jgi:hypothetical protein
MTAKRMTITRPIPDSRPLTPEPPATGAWPSPAPAERIGLWQRLILFLVGATLATLLVTAACLPPNPYGMGTHQRLGLPPCSFVIWFGIRCPACGMTTSWAHLMRGHILQSAQVNTGGMLLGLAALAGAPWMLGSAVRGRWWIGPLDPQWLLIGGGIIFLITSAQWCWRLM